MKKIYIGGNIYGAGNIGDDAVLLGIIRLIKSASPEFCLIIGTHRGRKLDYLSPDFEIVSSYNIFRLINAIRKSDCFISGGGTMIGDELGLSFPLRYNLKLFSLAKIFRKKTALLSVGANKLRSKSGVSMAREIIGLCDIVTLRDEESREVCLELYTGCDCVATSDPAFLLEAHETERTKRIKNNLMGKGKIFGVNVVNEVWAQENSYKRAIADACNYLYTQYGYAPVFFCNEVREGEFFDFDANSRTAELLKFDYQILEPVYYSPEEMIDIISCFDFVMGMRMHSLIFAAIAGTPFIGISRVDKVDNFMRMFGLKSSGSIDNCDSRQLVSDVECLLNNRKNFKSQLTDRVDLLRKECLKNVQLLRSLLNEPKPSKCKFKVSLIKHLLLSMQP
jgi:polysaccharide pyruvyl transferase WcaK-like protein